MVWVIWTAVWNDIGWMYEMKSWYKHEGLYKMTWMNECMKWNDDINMNGSMKWHKMNECMKWDDDINMKHSMKWHRHECMKWSHDINMNSIWNDIGWMYEIKWWY